MPIFHHSLPEYLSEDLERVSKRAMSIIAPYQSNKQPLDGYGLCTLRQRRFDHCSKLVASPIRTITVSPTCSPHVIKAHIA